MIRFVTDSGMERFRGARCLLRVDLNIERWIDEENFKLRAIIPSITFLLEREVRLLILSHRGRFGENPPSLRDFAAPLSRLLGEAVGFGTLADAGKGVRERVFLAENLRFQPQEEENSEEFAQKLASLGDFYVNDAFAVSHRQNASLTRISPILPSFGGLRLKKELEALEPVREKPRHPFVLILGGAKIDGKLRVTERLRASADSTLLGSSALSMGSGLRYELPEDYVTDDGGEKLDIGERTRERYAAAIAGSRLIVWNGPVGLFETERFAGGTRAVWEAIFANDRAVAVVGGGETVESVKGTGIGYDEAPSHVFLSTGGGAMLAYLSGKELPGLKALDL